MATAHQIRDLITQTTTGTASHARYATRCAATPSDAPRLEQPGR